MTEQSLDTLVNTLGGLATASLDLWNVPAGATLRLLNVSENVTFLVEGTGGYRSVLRVHRQGYHSRRAIECELAWLDALAEDGRIPVPRYLLAKDGEVIQELSVPREGSHRHMVLFDFIEGTAPDEAGDLSEGFETLGAMAAQCHLHALDWDRPEPFERLTWDLDAVFGEAPTWGDWRDAPGVTDEITLTLEAVEHRIAARLKAYGATPDRYNLIHADMRLANLIEGSTTLHLIDFDDSGFGWLMYDFAAAISFIEDDVRIPSYKAAWLRGYQKVRSLTAADLAEIDTLVMMRRLALLAWIGSHIEAPEPQALAPTFAATTAELGEAWLQGTLWKD